MDPSEYINKLISTFNMSEYHQDVDKDHDTIIKLCKDIDHRYNKTLSSYTKNELLGMYKNKNITYFLKILVMYHIFLKSEVELKNNIRSFNFEYTLQSCSCEECNPASYYDDEDVWDISCYIKCTKDILYITNNSLDNYVSHILNLELNDINFLKKVLYYKIDSENNFGYEINSTHLEIMAVSMNVLRIMSGMGI